MPKERPLICHLPMVQRILNSTKTQTRRVITPQPGLLATEGYWITSSTNKREAGCYQFTAGHWRDGQSVGEPVRCPQGVPGDLLWLRESWRIDGWDFEELGAAIQYKDGERQWCELPPDDVYYGDRWLEWLISQQERIAKLPGVTYDDETERYNWGDDVIPWKSPIFLPRWGTRQVLEVKGVKVERLKDISEEDAKAEGFDSVQEFALYWDVINGPRGFPWESDPWVNAVSFAKVKQK